jgi:glycosyltransferase involved in cell wall biosynthesis
VVSPGPGTVSRPANGSPLRFLWVIDLDHRSRMRHGGNLRWFSLSRELIRRGCLVHFAFNRQPVDALPGRRAYLEELQRERIISGFEELDYAPPRALVRLAALLTHPALADLCLRPFRVAVVAALRSLIARHDIDVCVVADRSFLFSVPPLARDLPVVVDWVDSFVLHEVRAIRVLFRARRLLALTRNIRRLLTHIVQERYYGRRAAVSLAVSPVDERCLDRVIRKPGKVRVLLNGVDLQAGAPSAGKDPNRLVFTGNMNFPPNHEAAVWFIDHVLPLVVEARPETRFVVAGRNPLPALRSRASDRVAVLGSVEDIRAEIAKSALYVAPLVSGGGFKNKVLEAIDAGTYVVATPVATEFLPPVLGDKLLVADSPRGFADHVLAALADRGSVEALLPELQRLLREEFTWAGRTDELIEVVRSLAGAPSG